MYVELYVNLLSIPFKITVIILNVEEIDVLEQMPCNEYLYMIIVKHTCIKDFLHL